jgi:hypothetical protein
MGKQKRKERHGEGRGEKDMKLPANHFGIDF